MPHEDVYLFNSLPNINVIPLDFDRPPESTQSQRGQRRSQTQPPDLRSMKVQEFLESSNLSANTRTSYTRQLTRFLEWTDLHWGDIKPRHISQYKAYLSHEALTTGQKKLSPSSVNSALGALHSFFKWISLAYPDLVSNNPTIGVKFHKIPETPDKALDPAEMGHIWAALDQLDGTKTRDTALIHLLSHGLRASEVVNLNIAGFDGNLLFLAETKNNENRVVPLNADGRAAIVLYLEERKAQGEVLEATRPLILSHHNVYGGERLTYHGIYFTMLHRPASSLF